MSAEYTLILVDGYNVLRSSGRYRSQLVSSGDHSHDPYNAAREALINDVARFAGRDNRAVIVFDGTANPESLGEPRQIANIEVIFSPSGVLADTVIEQRARQARNTGVAVLVVTSDAQTQWTVLGDKVTRMSAAGFADEVAALAREQAFDAEQKTVKTTLGERLNPQTRARLEALLRQRS